MFIELFEYARYYAYSNCIIYTFSTNFILVYPSSLPVTVENTGPPLRDIIF